MLPTPRTRSVASLSHLFNGSYQGSPSRLFDIPTKIELPARESDYAIEARLYLRSQIASHDQSLGFRPNRIERLHEVSLFQIAGIVGHDRRRWRVGVRPMPAGVAWRREAVASLDARRLAGATWRSKGRFSRAGRRADPSRRSGRARERKSGRRA